MKKITLLAIICVTLSSCLSISRKHTVTQDSDSTETNSIEPSTTDIKEVQKDIKLPFDYYDYLLWGDEYEQGETDEYKYPYCYFEDNPKMKKLYEKQNRVDEVPEVYMIVNSGATNFKIHLVSYMNRIPTSFEKLFTTNNDSIIDSITCWDWDKFELGVNDWKEQTFTISPTLEVTLYRNELNDGKIIKQHIVAKYKIDNDGRFINLLEKS